MTSTKKKMCQTTIGVVFLGLTAAVSTVIAQDNNSCVADIQLRASSLATGSNLDMMSCASESELKSHRGQKTVVLFNNQSNCVVKTYWLDYHGRRKLYKTLSSSQQWEQRTYVTHPWVIADENDQCLGIFLPKATKSEVVISGNDTSAAQMQWLQVVTKYNGKCLHVHGGSNANGANITLWDCVDQPNVQWRMAPANEPGYFFLIARHSGKCAHVHGGGNANGANITQWDCVNQGNVKWSKKSLGNGYFNLVAKNSRKCAHVHGGSNANEMNITQWDCVNQDNLKWLLKLVD